MNNLNCFYGVISLRNKNKTFLVENGNNFDVYLVSTLTFIHV